MFFIAINWLKKYSERNLQVVRACTPKCTHTIFFLKSLIQRAQYWKDRTLISVFFYFFAIRFLCCYFVYSLFYVVHITICGWLTSHRLPTYLNYFFFSVTLKVFLSFVADTTIYVYTEHIVYLYTEWFLL